jgi:hypothetical protein
VEFGTLGIQLIVTVAGFTVTLEDETDGDAQQCEFAAASPASAKSSGSKLRCGSAWRARPNYSGCDYVDEPVF